MSRIERTEKEALSALLDNEADDLELRRLLQEWEQLSPEQQAELAQSWSRFQLVKDVLHGQEVASAGNLAARIQAELAHEAPLQGNNKRQWASWQQNVAKLAIAASVAAVFVVGVQSSLQPSPPQPLVAEQAAPAAVPAVSTELDQPAPVVIAESTDYQVDPEAEQRMREYFQAITVDASEPAGIEHIQDSPLYRLVNQRQEPAQ